MRVLVAIANYGTGNREFLDRLVVEYQSMPWQVDIVVLSNIPKAVGSGVEVRVGLPDRNPWSLPFAHRRLFNERLPDYDLFIYSEDDTLVRRSNIEAFLHASQIMGPDSIPGFMRTETDEAGNVYVSSMHGFFRWEPAELFCRGDRLFVPFTNDHSACYLMTRDQLARAIAFGGFLVGPHEGRYDMLCTAATDPYTRCGMKRYVCVSRLSDFLLPHLPNKYIGRMGMALSEVKNQVKALERIAATDSWRGPLFEVETGLQHGEWSKDLYEDPSPDLIAEIPSSAKRVLSVGCGSGATESNLVDHGLEVTAVPVDPVFGDLLRRRGIATVEGPFPKFVEQLGNDCFDCVLLTDVLHLVSDPLAWLAELRPLIKRGTGTLVLSVPNTRDPWTQLTNGMRSGESEQTKNGHKSFVRVGAAEVKGWLKAAGFVVSDVRPIVSGRRKVAANLTFGMLRDTLAQRFVARARAL